MIQIFNNDRCPEWIKKKCKEKAKGKSIVTFSNVIYQTFAIIVGDEEKVFYVVRDEEVTKEKVINVLNTFLE